MNKKTVLIRDMKLGQYGHRGNGNYVIACSLTETSDEMMFVFLYSEKERLAQLSKGTYPWCATLRELGEIRNEEVEIVCETNREK